MDEARPAIPKELGESIKQFLKEHPEMGEHSLSGFTARACQRYLSYLRRQVYLADVIGGRAPPEVLDAEADETAGADDGER